MKKYIVILVTMFLSVGAFVGFYKGIEIYSRKANSEASEVKPPVYKVNSVSMVDTSNYTYTTPVEETTTDNSYDMTYTFENLVEEPTDTEDVIGTSIEENITLEDGSVDVIEDDAVEEESEEITVEIKEEALEELSDTPDGVIVMYVTEDAKVLNIRAEHNTTSKIVKTAKSGEEVWVYKDIMEEGFYKVYTEDGSEKWAYSTFLTKTP